MAKYISADLIRKAIEDLEKDSLIEVSGGNSKTKYGYYIDVKEFETKLEKAFNDGAIMLPHSMILKLLHECTPHHMVKVQMGKLEKLEGVERDG